MPRSIPTHKPASAGLSATSAGRAYRKGPARAELEAFYNGQRWRKLSTAYRAQNPMCAACLAEAIVTAATQVHHVKEIKIHPDLAYDWGNLESVCTRCHNRKRAKSRPSE